MPYILTGFAALFILGAILLGSIILIAHITEGEAISEKEKLAAAKLRTETLRADRLARDLAVVENRAILVSNQSVMVELRVEEKRRELGLGASTFTPTNP